MKTPQQRQEYNLNQFEKFISRSRVLPDTYVVSISVNRKFSLNKKITKEIIAPRGYRFVELYFDKEHRAVAIRFYKEGQLNALKLGFPKISPTVYITAQGFCKFYGIDMSKAQSYKADWDKANEMVVFNLNNPLGKRS